MRLCLAAAVLAAAVSPAAAANDLPDGVERLLTCGHTYSLRSEEAREAGDEDTALEFFHMGDALIWQARSTLESAGYSPGQVEDIDMNWALLTGFNYAATGEEMLAGCLAEWDSP